MFVSGLNFGGREFAPLATELLCEFITGNAGTHLEQATCARIVRVVVVGGLMDLPTESFADRVSFVVLCCFKKCQLLLMMVSLDVLPV